MRGSGNGYVEEVCCFLTITIETYLETLISSSCRLYVPADNMLVRHGGYNPEYVSINLQH